MSATLIDQTIRNYKILSRLGEGGMGTVYLARLVRAGKGLLAGTQVAVKVLHPHLAEQEDIYRRFRREAGLGLVISHPRVMATIDVGSERAKDGRIHFIVTEYLEGRTLRQRLDQDGPFPDDQVVSIGRQVAEGLEEIHSHGVIHRDIKPSNLFLDDSGGVKIGDLGLSRLLEPKTEISLPGSFLGSVAYAAPEQMQGDDVGPAADLYALGVTLYELAAGRNPFAGVDLRSTLHAQSHLAPPPLGESAPESSYFLDRMVRALLEKDPASRLGPAGRVARILDERERSEWWREAVHCTGSAAVKVGPRRQFRVMRATRLYGRDAELDQLKDGLKTAIVGRSGRVAVVSGEAGGGKTRLIDVAMEDPDLAGQAVLAVSRFLELAAPVPYFPLTDVLLEAFGVRHLSREERRQRLPELLREHLPERSVFADAFAALIHDRNGSDHVGRLPQDAIPALYAEVFRTLSVRRPLVLVIEELQWADRGSLRALEALLKTLGAFPVAVVLTARPVAFDADPEFPSRRAEFLDWVTSLPDVTQIRLDRLSPDSVQRIVRDIGVPRPSEQLLAERLHVSSEGNPGFLFALVEDLERRGKLRDVNLAEVRALPIPSSIVDFLGRRLDDVDPEARRFLEFASVFGTRFKLEPVIEGLQIDLVTASEILARLTRRHQLIRAFEQAYRFDHHLLRERIYRDIPPERRQSYHLAVARFLARRVTDPSAPTRDAYEAGIHFSLAEEHAEAARFLVGAVRYLVERSLYDRAERLALKAREHLDALGPGTVELSPRERFSVFENLGDVAGHIGRWDLQGQVLLSAARVANAAGDDVLVAESDVLLARYCGATGRFLAALQHAEDARCAALRAGNRGLEAAALRCQAGILRTRGQTDYEGLLTQADRLAREAGDEQGRAFGLLLLGQLYLAADRPAPALETLRDTLPLFEKFRDQRGRGRTFFHLARVYREIGDLTRAQKAAEVAARIAEANSDRSLSTRCAYLRGDLAMRRRRYRKARRLLEQVLDELRESADRTLEVYTLVALSIVLSANAFAQRDPAAASKYAERAVRLAQELQLPRQEASAYATLAFTYLARQRPRFALAVSRKGLRFAEQQDAGRKRAAEILFIHFRCLKALDRLEEARPFLGRARDLVLERAGEIAEPPVRRAFLMNVQFNATVLKEARRVLGPHRVRGAG